MNTVIEKMEVLGCNPALKARAKINAFSVLKELGVKETIASSLIMKKEKALKESIDINENLYCIIRLPMTVDSYHSSRYGLFNCSRLNEHFFVQIDAA